MKEQLTQAATKPLLSFSQISTYLRCRQEWQILPREFGTAADAGRCPGRQPYGARRRREYYRLVR